MKRMTLIQLGALVALVVFGAYQGARAQQPVPVTVCAEIPTQIPAEIPPHIPAGCAL